MPDFTTTAAASCGPAALAEAGVTPDDVDTLQLYDSFTITVLLLIEGLGFCPKGEGGAFVAEGISDAAGDLPLNTDGGGLSSCHSGMRGIFLLDRSGPPAAGPGRCGAGPRLRDRCRCGSGGWLSCIGAVVLGREHP